MRIPKRGEKGFTLIELLIVVAILGVLAAVIIPNVSRFFGAGEEEARNTEKASVQLAVGMMLMDNDLSMVPTNSFPDTGDATNEMDRFPDEASSPIFPAADPGKVTDPEGYDYANAEVGYVLYGHDITGSLDPADTNPDNGIDINYLPREKTDYYYTLDSTGIVHQYADDTGGDEL